MNATQEMRRKTRRFMIIAVAVALVAFIVIAWGGINKNLVYYWTPTDLVANGDKAYGATIRLGGMVTGGSIKNHAGVSGVEFDVHDGTSTRAASWPASTASSARTSSASPSI